MKFATCLGYLKVMAVYYAGDNAKPEARLWPSFEDSAQKYRVPFDETNPLAQLYLLLRGSAPISRLTTFSSIFIPLLPPACQLQLPLHGHLLQQISFSSQFTLISPNWFNGLDSLKEWTKFMIHIAKFCISRIKILKIVAHALFGKALKRYLGIVNRDDCRVIRY